jgi:hypothetical protein
MHASETNDEAKQGGRDAHRQPYRVHQQWHHRTIAHVPSDLVRDVDVLQPRDPLHRSQPSDCIPSRRRSEEIAQNPVVPREPVNESTGDDAPDLEPGLLVGSDGPSEEIDVLDDPVGLRSSEFDEGVIDGSGSEREADERNGTDSDVAINEGVGEDETGGLGAVESVRPGAERENVASRSV